MLPRRNALARSIPASAGQPITDKLRQVQRRVYPRECGAARRQRPRHLTSAGLSPRVRGSLCTACSPTANPWSIPASAGQPVCASGSSDAPKVYPRECGAARSSTARRSRIDGLSPRVRGSLSQRLNARRLYGSIPASAGQPLTLLRLLRLTQVYPRECGAAPRCSTRETDEWGLSPRVRGSLSMPARCSTRHWSIPASAGQPEYDAADDIATPVYPRECGAAL